MVNGLNGGLNVTGVQTTTTETTTTTTREGVPAARPVATYGCAGGAPMNEGDFSGAMSTINKEGFDETKLSTAKQIAEGNCMSAHQISEICKAFGFEETKLSFAKFAYKHCTEPQNYFKVNNVFGFSSSTDELNNYIEKANR